MESLNKELDGMPPSSTGRHWYHTSVYVDSLGLVKNICKIIETYLSDAPLSSLYNNPHVYVYTHRCITS